MTKRLKRVSPLQAGVVLGCLYAALGLVIVPIMLLIALIGAAAGPNGNEAAPAMIGGLIGIILLPILYGIMGFVGGIISALLYNLIAMMTGGLEFELVDA